MKFRPSAYPTGILLVSLVSFAWLVFGLYLHGRPKAQRPIIIYCAAALRLPLEAIAKDYQASTGQPVELSYGASEEMLSLAALANPNNPGDLFLPADESYIRMAQERDLVAEKFPLATMHAVVLVAPGNPKHLAEWADLLKPDVKVAIPARTAAVGRLTRDQLRESGRWRPLEARVIDTGTVTEAANAARLGSADAGIVWDAVAAAYPKLQVLNPPELAAIVANVEIATLKQSSDLETARHFVRFLTNPAQGLVRLRQAGFRVEVAE